MTEYQKQIFIDCISSHFVLTAFVRNSNVRNFIGCQFALESDFGRSALALNRHNYCGMKVPRKRLFYGSSDGNSPFAVYDSLNLCIRDYVAWLLQLRPSSSDVSSVENYAAFLVKVGYCPEKDYVERIRSIYNQYFN